MGVTLKERYRQEYQDTGEWPNWCWYCGAENEPAAPYCTTCGELLSAWEALCIVGAAGDE